MFRLVMFLKPFSITSFVVNSFIFYTALRTTQPYNQNKLIVAVQLHTFPFFLRAFVGELSFIFWKFFSYCDFFQTLTSVIGCLCTHHEGKFLNLYLIVCFYMNFNQLYVRNRTWIALIGTRCSLWRMKASTSEA